ncbi:hypothetical protein R1sor_010112 [Riccia sorocarpa]|uniref:Uncharacterized protein n=1 Tax=Riccia sorocarpa TaxID=122646 RepID=A0ABD3HYM9_9MARC
MPLAPRQIPHSVMAAGCKVATQRVHFKYLGVLASCPINESAIAQAIIKKLQGKLAHWSNGLLSWSTKILLLKHVLAATPLYQLMYVGLSDDGIENLEGLCRQFLWGWKHLKDMAKAMHVKCIAKLLLGDSATGQKLYTQNLAERWSNMRKLQRWDAELGGLPTRFSITQATLIFQKEDTDRGRTMGRYISLLKRGGIDTVVAGLRVVQGGHNWVAWIRSMGLHPEEEVAVRILQLEE